jgi:hypothetical protein
VADLHDGIARHLAALGLVAYDPAGPGPNDVFFDVMPASPDEAVCLTVYGGAPLDSLLPYDSPSLQVRTRGPATAVGRATARARAQDLYSELHGLGPVDLPDGTRLILAVANQSPGSMGQDDLGRLDYVFNLALELYAPSVHRPA